VHKCHCIVDDLSSVHEETDNKPSKIPGQEHELDGDFWLKPVHFDSPILECTLDSRSSSFSLRQGLSSGSYLHPLQIWKKVKLL